MSLPLMPKATAAWLVDNTSLSFNQIAEFCQLHILEVQALADDQVKIHGLDPLANGQLTKAEIERCEADEDAKLEIVKKDLPPRKKQKGPKYTPLSKRQDKPDAIAWLVKFHPELSDAQVSRLVGTTRPTIQAIRERTHWNSANLRPRNPVALGLCRQLDLDQAVTKAGGTKLVQELPEQADEQPAADTAMAALEDFKF